MSLQVNLVTKKFKEVTALKRVSMDFDDNCITGLIGFNGSGKTTMFNILTNLIEDYRGAVTITENKKKRAITYADHATFSYMAAGSEPRNSDRVMQHFYYLGALHGLSRLQVRKNIADLVQILEFKKQLSLRVKSLSKGNQQKIKIISVFLNPHLKYLLLDEPFDGLDPIMVEKVRKFIQQKQQKQRLTIIITSHRMEVVDELCDRYYILRKGVLVESKNKDELQDDTKIMIAVNKEVPVEFIKNIPHVLDVLEKDRENIILAENINFFKDIQQALATDTNYLWSSYRQKTLTESVFTKYAE